MSRSNDWVSKGRYNWYKRSYSYTEPDRLVLGRRTYNRHSECPYGHRWKGRHPSWIAKIWRQEYRTRLAHALRTCEDYDNLQLFPINKLTNAYDWY